MVNLRYHPASFRGVLANYNLLHAAEAESANGLAHAARAPNEAAHPLDLQRSRFFFLCSHRLGPLTGWRLRRDRRFLSILATSFSNSRRVFQMEKGVKSSLDHIVRIRRSQRLGQH